MTGRWRTRAEREAVLARLVRNGIGLMLLGTLVAVGAALLFGGAL